MARIYDPRRAEVYERLGIPTVATVRWTADQMLRKMRPGRRRAALARPHRQDRAGRGGVLAGWIGEQVKSLEASTTTRIAFVDRLGQAFVPEPGTVLQEGDVLHVVARESDLDRIAAAFATRGGEH